MPTYDKGQLVRVSGHFMTTGGLDIDPTTIKFDYRPATAGGGIGPITTYTYPTDVQLVRDSTGNYHVDLNANVSGTWYYRFYGTGTNQAANEDSFVVADSQF